MSLYKPSELLSFLETLGIKPKKSLSQNFLLDRNIIHKMTEAADVKRGDVILEIGPGPGSLTEALLSSGAQVIAVEKDRVLAEALHRFKGDGRELTIFCKDIMEFPLEKVLSPFLENASIYSGKVKVIANLPYHLTTPILTTLLPMHHLFSSIVVMVQDEVARRFTAKPKSKNWSSISIFIHYYSNPEYAFAVSRHCFYPKPKVESAVVKFQLKIPPFVSNHCAFFDLVHAAFKKRRKMLRSSLKDGYQNISESLENVGLNPLARPEDLSLDEFIFFFEKVKELQEGKK